MFWPVVRLLPNFWISVMKSLFFTDSSIFATHGHSIFYAYIAFSYSVYYSGCWLWRSRCEIGENSVNIISWSPPCTTMKFKLKRAGLRTRQLRAARDDDGRERSPRRDQQDCRAANVRPGRHGLARSSPAGGRLTSSPAARAGDGGCPWWGCSCARRPRWTPSSGRSQHRPSNRRCGGSTDMTPRCPQPRVP